MFLRGGGGLGRRARARPGGGGGGASDGAAAVPQVRRRTARQRGEALRPRRPVPGEAAAGGVGTTIDVGEERASSRVAEPSRGAESRSRVASPRHANEPKRNEGGVVRTRGRRASYRRAWYAWRREPSGARERYTRGGPSRTNVVSLEPSLSPSSSFRSLAHRSWVSTAPMAASPMTVAAVVMSGALDPPMAFPVSTSYLANLLLGALHCGQTYSLPCSAKGVGRV